MAFVPPSTAGIDGAASGFSTFVSALGGKADAALEQKRLRDEARIKKAGAEEDPTAATGGVEPLALEVPQLGDSYRGKKAMQGFNLGGAPAPSMQGFNLTGGETDEDLLRIAMNLRS